LAGHFQAGTVSILSRGFFLEETMRRRIDWEHFWTILAILGGIGVVWWQIFRFLRFILP